MKNIKDFILESIDSSWKSNASWIQHGKYIKTMKKQIRNIFFDTNSFSANGKDNRFPSFLSTIVIYPYLQDIKWNDEQSNYGPKINVKDFYDKYFSSPEDFIEIEKDKNYKALSYWCQLLHRYVDSIKDTLKDKSSTEYKNMEKYWSQALEEANSNKILDKLIDFYEDIYKKNKDKIETKTDDENELWQKTYIFTKENPDIKIYA